MTLFITGASGFVGSNLIRTFNKWYTIIKYKREEDNELNCDVVIHLAGKSIDSKSVSDEKEYYDVNTELTKSIFNVFLKSEAKVFLYLSSVKAVADTDSKVITENTIPSPITHYGKSKLLAENYIMEHELPNGKKVFVLRSCIIHGPGNKGNLNLLYNLVTKGIPWPLGAYNNQRSYCSIDNLLFVIKTLIERDDIPSGIYNVADDEPISTNDLISLIAQSQNTKPKIWKVSKRFINFISKIGDKLHLPINTERLQKLTDSNVVSNAKLKNAIGKNLPFSTREGLLHTFLSFKR
jgi:nucleoside-diphosphate-sugar epimerase